MGKSTNTLIDEILALGYKPYLVGGGARDERFVDGAIHKDLDIVVDGENEANWVKLLPSFTTNSFGGYKVNCENGTVDIWALHNTRTDLLGCEKIFNIMDYINNVPFFNCDAVAYCYTTKTALTNAKFEKCLSSRQLCINRENKYNPACHIKNAIKLAGRLNLSISSKLARYMYENSSI